MNYLKSRNMEYSWKLQLNANTEDEYSLGLVSVGREDENAAFLDGLPVTIWKVGAFFWQIGIKFYMTLQWKWLALDHIWSPQCRTLGLGDGMLLLCLVNSFNHWLSMCVLQSPPSLFDNWSELAGHGLEFKSVTHRSTCDDQTKHWHLECSKKICVNWP